MSFFLLIQFIFINGGNWFISFFIGTEFYRQKKSNETAMQGNNIQQLV